MGSLGGENRQITTAVIVSLLLHGAVLWLGQEMSLAGREKSIPPATLPVEVSLLPGRPLAERTVVQREPRPIETARTPLRNATEPAVTQTANDADDSTPQPAEAAAKQAEAGAVEANEPSPQSSSVDAGLRDRYLAAVLAHIESHKFYPVAARRRGLQGSVHVCFTLDARGMVSDLDVTGNNSMFVEAARSAIHNALPLPIAPSLDGFPLVVHYQMTFKLQ